MQEERASDGDMSWSLLQKRRHREVVAERDMARSQGVQTESKSWNKQGRACQHVTLTSGLWTDVRERISVV